MASAIAIKSNYPFFPEFTHTSLLGYPEFPPVVRNIEAPYSLAMLRVDKNGRTAFASQIPPFSPEHPAALKKCSR